MMNYLIITDGIITNIIVCENDEVASQFNAVSSYDGADIGKEYNPPEPEPVPEPEEELSVWDELDAAYQKGVDSV